ncbi:PQQ-dependent sugar dehydrogenase [Corynebacterium hylobatis]|uniref:PQQ-dependent sugar dehydrogenase n=1 Tax=Corynebacterium hylobatis TaxID=1859290 RepID=A0A3S0BJA6_9CORY|nr:PQQ-dependent sugar dehydrogenase [Corynebacterium hylobatis]RSZ65536.1 PQQ-dependent sugar dehydrogenase [Corynebacterium hylobatis]
MRRLLAIAAATVLSLTSSACAGADTRVQTEVSETFTVTEHGTFNEGWAMSFLPGTGHLLISERGGALQLRDQGTGEVTEVSGTPEVHHAGQAGMHNIIPGPDFEDDGTVYLSWVRDHEAGAQGVVGRATLDVDAAALQDLEVIWEQTPTSGDGHFALRMLIQDDHLYLTSGDRQKFSPAQERETNLGAVLRLTLNGDPAPDNPWAGEGNTAAQLWTIGHRNPLGIAEDSGGRIWVSEMGPRGGDELNLLAEGENYGWPEASMGRHYDGRPIRDHTEDDGFRAPAEYWVPSISPGSLLIYQGDLFDGWEDSALLGGLSGETLVRVQLDGEDTEIVEQWDMGERIRALAEAPDGALWVLEDDQGGRLLELRPA